MRDGFSRRDLFAKATAGSAGALLSLAGPVIEKAYGAGPCSGHLTDIEHFVLLMQENRSYDHYFGTLSGTDGFNAPSPLFQQKGWNPQTQALDPPASRCPTASIPPGAPGCSTTPTTPGSGTLVRGTAVPITTGCRRRPRAIRRPNPHHDGLLHPRRHPDPLPARRCLHGLRSILLLGVGPHLAQPPVLAERHARPGRNSGRAAAGDPD